MMQIILTAYLLWCIAYAIMLIPEVGDMEDLAEKEGFPRTYGALFFAAVVWTAPLATGWWIWVTIRGEE